ncbi:MAG: hypothetical protein A2W31_05015 [Planctomycetes bacterium RBG_16_64_10]|nr:MAG: hypothetical protein A2W31_05015 [Planctomycetes bacterium RBG_16_64_10]
MGLPAELDGARYESPVQEVSDFNNVPIKPAVVLEDRRPRRIEMLGHWQQAALYAAHRDKVRAWFAPSLPRKQNAAGTIAVHVRIGDYACHGWLLPPAYYTFAVAQAKALCGNVRVMVATDDRANIGPYMEAIRAAHFQPQLLTHSDGLDDFEWLMGARALVCSNSTFAWWAAFLGTPEYVWMPHNWQPWGIGQPGDGHLGVGAKYPSDFRFNAPGWHIVDMTGGVPK